MAAHGLRDEVLAFDGDEAGGGSASAGKGGAEFLNARVLTAFNEAEAGANGAGGHRGDFTPYQTPWRRHFPLSLWGEGNGGARTLSGCFAGRRMLHGFGRDDDSVGWIGQVVYTYWKCFAPDGARDPGEPLSAEMLRVHPDEPEADRVKYIVSCLRAGSVVGMPTDTFYGLAVDPVNLRAVESIYEIKSRLKHKPLSLLMAEVEQAYDLARELGRSFDVLAERFWPGPLTLIVRAGAKLPLRSTANTGNVALRVPDAAIPRAVVAAFGLPITATSANLHGAPECTHAAGVRDQIGERIPLIVDGGPTARQSHTTIVDLSGGDDSWQILREGSIATHEIALALQN